MRSLIEVGPRLFSVWRAGVRLSFKFRPLRAGPEQAVLCL